MKLFSAVPHSMADEKTRSYITMLNTAQRSRQNVNTVAAMAQVHRFYMAEKPKKVRKQARAQAALWFFNVKRVTREIDDDERHNNLNYNKSDDEEDINTESSRAAPNSSSPAEGKVVASTTLPGEDGSSELDLDN
ncbi:hypothetical protein NMY22_g12779 [Coprinellus aureogranulatus]|nr:hypothetical protein NMY22_g12779 [Coprinellus aureogranulatus]